jgi:hypothetical protein
MEETKNNENENMWVSCQFGIDKSNSKQNYETKYYTDVPQRKHLYSTSKRGLKNCNFNS